MADTYSLYEAKAKLSAIIRQVREGHSVTVTVHGEPVAEIRPIEKGPSDIHSRMEELAARGILIRPENRELRVKPIARRPGALAQFLADRDD